jgi:hypothetical protein
MTLVIKKGVKDPYCANIQRALNEIQKITPPLVCDGDFGGKSEFALQTYQTEHGYPMTGVYEGPAQKELDAFIRTKYLTESDFAEAARRLGVDVASVKAVQTVESRGSGFLPDGRLIILFERHIFRRELDKLLDADSEFAKKLCEKFSVPVVGGQLFAGMFKVWMSKNFPDIYNSTPGGYIGGGAEWSDLEKARTISETAALLSASYGLFQVMGFHWKLLGYASVQAMVEDHKSGESRQLMAFCNFILANPNLLSALRKRDWAALAKGYNGPGYAVNKYDVKLASAYLDAQRPGLLSSYVPILA